MPADSFVHLHSHTEYSLLDGAVRIGAAMRRAREYGMPALAITDHGNMFGAIEFYDEAHKAGIKPIVGCEVYVAPESHLKKSATVCSEHSPSILSRISPAMRGLRGRHHGGGAARSAMRKASGLQIANEQSDAMSEKPVS